MEKYPRSSAEISNLKDACKKFVLPGHKPAEPLFKKSDFVWTSGSCFAENIGFALTRAGIKTLVDQVVEEINTPLALRLTMEGALTGSAHNNSPENLLSIRGTIETATVAILTLGVGAAAFDKDENMALKDNFHHWRALTFAECKSDIERSVIAIRKINPNILIFLTLSPVPLNRSYWNDSPMVADCVSKSTIRAALAEYFSSSPRNVFYWPAFEMVRWLGSHIPNAYGADDGLLRHVSRNFVDVIVDLFLESYCA